MKQLLGTKNPDTWPPPEDTASMTITVDVMLIVGDSKPARGYLCKGNEENEDDWYFRIYRDASLRQSYAHLAYLHDVEWMPLEVAN